MRTALLSLVLGAGCSGARATPVPVARAWPVVLEEPPVPTAADLDGDGFAEERVDTVEGGSGWRGFTTCVRDGASGHVACTVDATTPYSRFSGSRRVLDPLDDNRAARHLPESACPSLPPGDPARGALEASKLGAPLSGTFAPPLSWHPGRPVEQVGVCMSEQEAVTYPGGLSWQLDSGAGEGWRVWYAAAWPASFEPRGPAPERLVVHGPLEIYQHGHALAVYDVPRDRHAWIANFGHSPGGFKVDRWQRIAGVTFRGPHTLDVQVADLEGGDIVTIDLAAAR
ncbi:MAG: hypothetical protein Q8P41_05130 [Pseudomonadota bacterium]|nr:hypothetical protein [Pseudomonadota bacterium]